MVAKIFSQNVVVIGKVVMLFSSKVIVDSSYVSCFVCFYFGV